MIKRQNNNQKTISNPHSARFLGVCRPWQRLSLPRTEATRYNFLLNFCTFICIGSFLTTQEARLFQSNYAVNATFNNSISTPSHFVYDTSEYQICTICRKYLLRQSNMHNISKFYWKFNIKYLFGEMSKILSYLASKTKFSAPSCTN